MANKTDKFYDDLAKKLAKDGSEKLDDLDLYRMRIFLKIILKKGRNKTIDVLDIGTRNGWLNDFIVKNNIKNINYHALDISEHYVNLMKKRKIQVYKADITKKINIKKNFDVIVMGELIEHITNLNLAFENCKLLLKKDGILIGSTPHVWNIAYIFKAFFNMDTDSVEEHIYLFDKWHLRNLFKMNEFKINKIWVEPFSFSLTKFPRLNLFLSKITNTGVKLFFIVRK